MRRDLAFVNDRAAAQIVLREMVDLGLVNTRIGALDYEPLISVEALEWSERRFHGTGVPNTADFGHAGASPKSLHFRGQSRGRKVHNGTAGVSSAFAAWNVELARFEVPRGHVGVVKGFEQYLAQQSTEQPGIPAYIYTQNSRWGVPGPWLTGVGGTITDDGTWYFRLRNKGRRSPPWFESYGQLFALPDLPYTDFPKEEGIWWPAGSAASQNTHWLIPEGYMLRVIYVAPEQNALLEVAAKVKGFIQTNKSVEMAHNLRTNW
jgi:hypothetical protein